MPSGWLGKEIIRCNAYYEFKDVPSKGRVYRYWYFRFEQDGRMRSVYCGKQRPTLSPLEAFARFREQPIGYSLNRRDPAGKLPKPHRGGRA